MQARFPRRPAQLSIVATRGQASDTPGTDMAGLPNPECRGAIMGRARLRTGQLGRPLKEEVCCQEFASTLEIWSLQYSL